MSTGFFPSPLMAVTGIRSLVIPQSKKGNIMMKLLSALVAAFFAVASVTPVAFAQDTKKSEEKKSEKSKGDEMKAEKSKAEAKKADADGGKKPSRSNSVSLLKRQGRKPCLFLFR
jgi:pentapeptide MXKDX repeat protein